MFLTLKICCSVHEFKLFLNLCKLFLLSNNWTGCTIMSMKWSQLMWCVHEIQNVNLLWLTVIMSPQTKFGRHIVFAPFLIIKSPKEVLGTSCFCTVSSYYCYYYYGSQTKFVRHIVFALFLIIIIKSPNEVWRLIVFAPFPIKSPNEVLGTSCFCTVSYYYYYYITPTVVRWCIVILRFFFTIIIILILILPHTFVRSISRRCLSCRIHI